MSFLVTILPQERFISVPGGNALISCIISGNATVQWLVNGSSADNTVGNAVTTTARDSMNTLGSLRLSNLSATYNQTRITCVTTLSETAQIVNASVILLLQGSKNYASDVYNP